MKLIDYLKSIPGADRAMFAERCGTTLPAAAGREFDLAPREAALYTLLADAPLHIDDLITKCGLTVGEVSATLLRLELKGAVMQLPGKMFAIS